MSGQRTTQLVALVLLGLSIVQMAARPGALDLLAAGLPAALEAIGLFLAAAFLLALGLVALVAAVRHLAAGARA